MRKSFGGALCLEKPARSAALSLCGVMGTNLCVLNADIPFTFLRIRGKAEKEHDVQLVEDTLGLMADAIHVERMNRKNVRR